MKPPSISFEDCVANPRFLTAFRKFLQENRAEESLLCYEAILQYETLSDQKLINDAFKNIAVQFLKPGAPLEVNVNQSIIQPILACTQPKPSVFENLKRDLARLLREDPFRRFLVSNSWAEFSNEFLDLKNSGSKI